MRRVARHVGARAQSDAGTPDLEHVALHVENRAGRRQLGSSPKVLRAAVRLVAEAGPGLLAGVVFLVLLTAAITLAQLVVVREVLGRLLDATEGVGPGLLPALLALVGLVTLGQLASSATGLLQRLLGQRVLRRTSGDVLDVTSEVPLRAYEDSEFFGHLVRVQQNGLSKPMEVVQALVSLAAGGATSVLLVVFVATIEPLLVPLLVVAAVPSFLSSRREGREEFGFTVEQVTGLRRRGYVVSVMGAGATARELRSFETAPHFRRQWSDLWDGYLTDLQALCVRRFGLSVIGTLTSAALIAGVAAFLVVRLEDGALSVASAGAAVVALRMLSSRALEAAKGLGSLLETRPYLEDLRTFLETYAVDGTGSPSRLDGPPEVIEFRDVSFRYPGAVTDAVEEVSLTLRRGEVVALVGQNGSGKTTLTSVLAALHAPTGGEVLWDGVPLVDTDLPAARAHVCAVFQDFVRYALEARQNIALEDPADEERLARAVRHAGADFLLGYPAGLDTMLSKEYRNGRSLSVGQWQRVALARAFYRDKPILVLDEPTSALDARAEFDLFERLRELWAGRTVVFVSHRLSSARLADRVVVMHEGRVVEQGSHDALVAAGGRYADLYELQAQGYRETPSEDDASSRTPR